MPAASPSIPFSQLSCVSPSGTHCVCVCVCVCVCGHVCVCMCVCVDFLFIARYKHLLHDAIA